MKKLFYMISAVAIATSFASCNKVEQENNTPVVTPAVDGTTTLTISAAVPQTKTNLHEGTVRWSASDVIAVMAEGYELVRSLPVDAAAPTFDFTVEGWPAGVTPQYAAFTGPYTKEEYYAPYKPTWNEDGTIQMTVRSDQPIYNQGSFSKLANISIGELNEAEGGNFTALLKNVCGLIKFTLTKPTSSVEIANANTEGQSMAGKVNVAMENGVPRATFIPKTGGNITITSNISKSDNVLAHDGARTYYAVVIPGTYTPKITITPVEGEPIILTAKSPVTITRNEFVDFGELDKVVVEDDDETVETMNITVEMPYPFNPNLPTSATKTKDTYTLKDTDYTFVLYNPTDGYRLTNSTLRLSSGTASGYIQFPAVSGWTLVGFEITSGNGTKKKDYDVYALDPIEVTTENESIAHVALTDETPVSVTLSGTSAGVGYFLESHSTNAQFRKLVLTYAKVQ